MRVVIDTNILISALISRKSPPRNLFDAWQNGKFILLTSVLQLDEIRRVTRRQGVKVRIQPADAGRMVNILRTLAQTIDPLPQIDVSPDPYDNYLLALAQTGKADLLVTGDKLDLLALKKYKSTRIVSARDAEILLLGK